MLLLTGRHLRCHGGEGMGGEGESSSHRKMSSLRQNDRCPANHTVCPKALVEKILRVVASIESLADLYFISICILFCSNFDFLSRKFNSGFTRYRHKILKFS